MRKDKVDDELKKIMSKPIFDMTRVDMYRFTELINDATVKSYLDTYYERINAPTVCQVYQAIYQLVKQKQEALKQLFVRGISCLEVE